MKKILALVLAVAMLSTVAFAVGFVPGDKSADAIIPGKDFTIGVSSFSKLPTIGDGANQLRDWEFTSDNFAVVPKYGKGADLVSKVEVKEATGVKFTLKANNTLVAPTNVPNLQLDKVTLKAKKTIKDVNGDIIIRSGASFELVVNETAFVGHQKNETLLDGTGLTLDNGGKYYAIKAGKDSTGKEVYSDIVDMTSTDDVIYTTGKVYADDKIYAEIDEVFSDAAKAIAKKPENDEATLSNYTVIFDGLAASHKIIISAEKDAKIYKIDANGKLVPSGLQWSDDEYAFVGKIRTTTEYLISDVELKGVTTGGSETTNPDTGANDVVGIAAALAVVSLVAAGAVSLKK